MVWNLFYSCRIGGLGMPLADDNGSFSVLLNDEEQHSLWPAFTEVAADWRVLCREADRA
jgi:uncharacterized protein YbdZ (MbtH family)